MDLSRYRAKLVGTDDERAVSPVIGVILMVAITVILAAVIAAFVLDLGQGQQANAQAGIDFDEDTSEGEVEVIINSVERADEIRIEGDCEAASSDDETTFSSPSAGDSTTMDCKSDETIQVIGVNEGSENIITTFDYSG